jgi:cysteine synthase
MTKSTWGPTYEEMLHPETVGPEIRERIRMAGTLDPVKLFDITWKGKNTGESGQTGSGPSPEPFYIVIPREITGVEANVVVLYGRDFPTGSHKVGAAYSVTMEAQLAGETRRENILVFPSTGNYGIGGAWVGPRMGYDTLVILPELMSRERFELIEEYGARYVRTPGGESSVREIYQKCWELKKDPRVRVLNQFETMGNYRFHYYVTGNTVVELMGLLKSRDIGNGRCSAFVSAVGSAGTISAGDRLKQVFPETRVVGLEPIQCPTLYCNGYGDHDIQGIGDKHVTWIHNVRNMDLLMCVDDTECKLILQVLSDPAGQEYLAGAGLDEATVQELSTMFGISGVCNLIGAIKTAKYYRLGPDETVVTVLTDGIDRYYSVMDRLTERFGHLTGAEAKERHRSVLLGAKLDYIQEGTVLNRDRWFNLKYYTWVEQQGKRVEELNAQRSRSWWKDQQDMVGEIDRKLKAVRGQGGGLGS